MDKVMDVNEVKWIRSKMSVRSNGTGHGCQWGQMGQVKDVSARSNWSDQRCQWGQMDQVKDGCQWGQMDQVMDVNEVKWIRSWLSMRSNGSGNGCQWDQMGSGQRCQWGQIGQFTNVNSEVIDVSVVKWVVMDVSKGHWHSLTFLSNPQIKHVFLIISSEFCFSDLSIQKLFTVQASKLTTHTFYKKVKL